MATTKMFSKFKGGGASNPGSPNFDSNYYHRQAGSSNLTDCNPISQYFEIGKLSGSAGPELSWKIYDAFKKSDKKVKIS